MTPRFHTWVINLDRAPQRLARVGRRLDELGLPWTRLPAVEGRLMSHQEQTALLDATGFEARHGMSAVAGEWGCYASHLKAFEALIQSNCEWAVVLEDDVVPTAGLPAVLEALDRLGERWDLVKLSVIHSGTPQRVAPLAEGYSLAVMLSRCTGSSAYAVNRRAAQRLLEGLQPMQLPFDHAFDRGWLYGLKVRRVVPEPCLHDDQIASTIGNPGPARKFHWSRRLPAYAYRLKNELQRLAYGLRHWLFVR